MHTIRLRGPWELEPIARFEPQPDGSYCPMKDNLPPASRAQMPADWSEALGRDFFGRVGYRRIFNKPTGLDSGARVWLVVEPPQSEACVVWKQKLLGFVHAGDPAGRFDITELLEDHNHLEIIVDHPALDGLCRSIGDPVALPPGGLVGEVRLEIEE